MKQELNFEDWIKFNLVVGEIAEINGNEIKIDVGKKILDTNKKLNVKIGDKIVVGLEEGNLKIPLVGNSVIVPDTLKGTSKDIENGSRVG